MIENQKEGEVVYRVSDRGSLSCCQDRANIATISSERGYFVYMSTRGVDARACGRARIKAGMRLMSPMVVNT